MNLKDGFKFLVIVGAWNRNIFTDQWIKKFLIPNDDFTLEMTFGPVQSHRISTDKIRIEFENGRISLIPIKFDLEVCESLIELATKLADYLPHTPVSGYGLNLVFEMENQKIDGSLIKICDKDHLISNGIKYIDSQYRHRFKFDSHENFTVNLNVTPSEKICVFDFNFHADIKDLVDFKGSISTLNIKKL